MTGQDSRHESHRTSVEAVNMSAPPDPVFVLRGATAPVVSLTFIKPHQGHNTQQLAAGTQDGHILIWDLKTKCLSKEWLSNGTSIQWLHSESPQELWALERHEDVKVWDTSSSPPTLITQFPIDGYLGFGQAHTILLNDRTKLLAIPGPEQEGVSVWDVDKKFKICSLLPKDPKGRGSLMQVRWVTVGGKVCVATVYESGHLALWDWSNNRIISECQITGTENPICFTYNEDIKMGIVGTASEKVFVVLITEDLDINILKEINITNPGLSSCVVRPDGKLYVTGGWDSRIRIFSSKKHKSLAVLQYHKKTVECLAYSEGDIENSNPGWLLAAGSSDKSVSLWNLYNS